MNSSNTPLLEFLPYLMSVTSNAVSGRIGLEYKVRFGLSVPEWRVMAVLGDHEPLTQRELTVMTLMDKVAVNRACKGLEERALIARSPNAQDGRSHLLELTVAGRDMHGQIMPLAIDMTRRIMGVLSESEQHQFRGLLERVRGQVGHLDGRQVDGAAISDDWGLR